MQAGSTLTIDNSGAQSTWTAVFDATGNNLSGVTATINLTFSNFAETPTLKVESGNNLDNANPGDFDLPVSYPLLATKTLIFSSMLQVPSVLIRT